MATTTWKLKVENNVNVIAPVVRLAEFPTIPWRRKRLDRGPFECSEIKERNLSDYRGLNLFPMGKKSRREEKKRAFCSIAKQEGTHATLKRSHISSTCCHKSNEKNTFKNSLPNQWCRCCATSQKQHMCDLFSTTATLWRRRRCSKKEKSLLPQWQTAINGESPPD